MNASYSQFFRSGAIEGVSELGRRQSDGAPYFVGAHLATTVIFAIRAHSSDRERSIRSIMNTDSGDHERLPGSAGGGPDERHGVMAGYCHRQLSPLILSGVSSSLQSRP